MDLTYSDEELAFQKEVRDYLAEALPASLSDKVRKGTRLTKEDYLQWHGILRAKGWLAQHWPVEHGGTGWGAAQKAIFDEEIVAAASCVLDQTGLPVAASAAVAGTQAPTRPFPVARRVRTPTAQNLARRKLQPAR